MTDMDPNGARALRQLVESVHTLRRQVNSLSRATPSRHTSIDSGPGLVVAGADGEPVFQIGPDANGVVAPIYSNGPTPNTPAAPAVGPGPSTATVVTDGLDANGNPAPADHQRTVIHASLSPDFEPNAGTMVGSMSDAAGVATISLPAGMWHIRIVWVTLSGQTSAPSAQVDVDVEPVVDTADIEATLQTARDELAAAIAGVEGGGGSLEGLTPPITPANDGVVYYQRESMPDGPVVAVYQYRDGTWNAMPLADAVLTSVTTDKLIAGTSLIGGALIGEGQIIAPHIVASEALTAKVGQFLEIQAGQIAANAFEGGMFTGGTFTGALFQTVADAMSGVKLTGSALRAYSELGAETVRLNGTDNLIVGRLNTNPVGESGIVLVPRTTGGQPGIWFSQTGLATGDQAAVFVDSNWVLNIRGRSGAGGDTAELRILGGLDVVTGATVMRGNTTVNGSLYNPGHSTTPTAANVYMNPTSGLISRSTSARKYKMDIRPAEVSDDILDLEVKTWVDVGEEAEREDLSTRMGPLTEREAQRLSELSEPGRARYIGMIADEWEEVDPRFVTYDGDGEVDALAYDRLGVALYPIVRRQRDRIESLEDENASLKDRLARIEAHLGL